MEFLAVIGIPILLMILAAGFLLVSQVTGFMNSGSLSRVRQSSDTVIQQYMVQIALAQRRVSGWPIGAPDSPNQRKSCGAGRLLVWR